LSFLFASGCGPTGNKRAKAKPDEALTAEAQSEGEAVDRALEAAAGTDATILAYRGPPLFEPRVTSGELPPVEERLPENPLVVTPFDRPGTYGGSIRRAAIADIADYTTAFKTLNENLMVYDRVAPFRIRYNLAESHEFEPDGRSVTIRLRRGLRWSDGMPFTVDDILFWYNDVILDEEARNDPIFPSRWMNSGHPVVLEKLDPLSLQISSPRPMGMILDTLSYERIAIPKHRFAPIHPRYNPDATYDEFRVRTTPARLTLEPGTPSLSAWIPVSWTRAQRVLFERNPYYWKVDTQGNQLPYADTFEISVIPSTDLIALKFINGEIDLIGHYRFPTVYQSLKYEERRQPFTVHLGDPFPTTALFLNWDADRPALREAFRNRDVRIALSQALNRSEISEIVYQGLLTATGDYTSFDPEHSRTLLDRAGYRDVDGDGFRELLDGSRFELTIDGYTDSEIPDICQLVAPRWDAIGVKTHLRIAMQEIITPRRINGEFEVTFYNPPADLLISSEKVAITGSNEPFWHRNALDEGPHWLRELTDLINRAKETVDREKRLEQLKRIQNIYTENIPFIPLGDTRWIWAASDRLGNLPPQISTADYFRNWPWTIFHEQLFVKE
jgi:peptide/nickel transport system substrate-binding protein